jgi:hypothetical protein
MNIHSDRSRFLLVLIIACLFFSGYTNRSLMAGAGYEEFANIAPRLVIERIPNLGYNVIVDLWIDGAIAAPIGYGHRYETLLSPGRHVLSLLPTPSPKWPVPSEVILDVRNHRTYYFQVVSDHSGSLGLQAN